MSGRFSDRGRVARMGGAVAILLALGLYYAWVASHLESGYRWCLQDPTGRDGSRVVFPLWTVTAIDGPDRYEISKIVKDVPVIGDARPLHVGDTVSVDGVFSAVDLTVHEQVREIHVLRRWKEGLGVAGMLLAMAAGPFAFRWRDGRLVPRG